MQLQKDPFRNIKKALKNPMKCRASVMFVRVLIILLLFILCILNIYRINETKDITKKYSPYISSASVLGNKDIVAIGRDRTDSLYGCSITPPPLISQTLFNTTWCPRRCSCGTIGGNHIDGIDGSSNVICFPHFLITGANKAGTSSLYHYLSYHPSIRSAGKKELHYWTFRFSLNREKVIKYLNNFSSTSLSHYQHSNQCFLNQEDSDWLLNSKLLVTGEATPDIHFYPIALHRLRILLPQVKLILLRRSPFELAFSVYSYNRGKFMSNKNYKKIIELYSLSKYIQSNYSKSLFNKMESVLDIRSDINMGKYDKEKQASLMNALDFKDWIMIFGFELESCLTCRASSTVDVLKACQCMTHLASKNPSLYRWQEDVALNIDPGTEADERISFGGIISKSEQCWFPPNSHHLNFFSRSAFDLQIEMFKKFFPLNQLLVVNSKELFQNTQHVLNQVVQFLQLDYYEFSPEHLAIKLQGPLRLNKRGGAYDQVGTLGNRSNQNQNQKTAASFHELQKPATDHSATTQDTRQLFLYLHSYLRQPHKWEA